MSQKFKILLLLILVFHKSLNFLKGDDLRNKILNELIRYIKSLGLVQTTHGRLNIFCTLDNYQLKSNYVIKTYKSDEYDIDIFATIDYPSR